MKKLLSFLIIFLILCSFFAFNTSAEESRVTVDGITYTIMSDHAILYECDRNLEGEITVPSEVEGKPLTVIGVVGFSNCKKITKINLPNTITSIERLAFYKCEKLVAVNIPKGVTKIEDALFGYCESLVSLKLSDNIASIGEDAFYKCSKLLDFEIPPYVTTIGPSAFAFCSSLNTVTIPETVTRIEKFTFRSCSMLRRVRIPENCEYIGMGAFSNCYAKINGIPNKVKTIGAGAFEYCDFEKIVIPSGVTEIPEAAFRNCQAATELHIPESVTKIDKDAFNGDYEISAIYYEGTRLEWKKIEIAVGNNIFDAAKVVYIADEEKERPVYGIDPNASQPTSNATVAESNESTVLQPEENEETVDVPADSGSDCINQPNVGLIVLIAVVFCSVCIGLSALIVFANKPKDR